MSEYHGRAKRAIAQLMGRQVVLQIITFSCGIVMARKLGAGPFGLYVISTTIVSVFSLLGDFGISPSFVQRKAELTDHDIQVAFTLQQLLTTGIVLTLAAAAPLLARAIYPDIPGVAWLVRALSFNLYLASWRTMSALQLERELKFDRLAKVEVLEMVIYQAVALSLALAGCGAWSFVAASLAQGIVGNTLIYAAAPWRVRLRWDGPAAVQLIRYGLPFQAQMILNQLGASFVPIVIGHVVGEDGVGFLMWASANGRKPMMLTDNIMRVGFPHFARIQDDRPEVERTVGRYLGILMAVAGLWFVALYTAMPGAVQWVYGPKWLPAVTALVLYAVALPLDMMSMVGGMTLNGIGQLTASTACATTRTVLNIGLASVLVLWVDRSRGFNAVALAYVVTSAVTVPWMLTRIRPGSGRRILGGLAWVGVPTAAGVAVGWAANGATARLPLPVHVVAADAAASAAFLAVAAVVAPAWLRQLVGRKLPLPDAWGRSFLTRPAA